MLVRGGRKEGAKRTEQQLLIEARWERILQEEISKRGHAEWGLAEDRKGGHGGLRLPRNWGRETTVGNAGIAERSFLGHRGQVE